MLRHESAVTMSSFWVSSAAKGTGYGSKRTGDS
jgi:hypothetical protein